MRGRASVPTTPPSSPLLPLRAGDTLQLYMLLSSTAESLQMAFNPALGHALDICDVKSKDQRWLTHEIRNWWVGGWVRGWVGACLGCGGRGPGGCG